MCAQARTLQCSDNLSSIPCYEGVTLCAWKTFQLSLIIRGRKWTIHGTNGSNRSAKKCKCASGQRLRRISGLCPFKEMAAACSEHW